MSLSTFRSSLEPAGRSVGGHESLITGPRRLARIHTAESPRPFMQRRVHWAGDSTQPNQPLLRIFLDRYGLGSRPFFFAFHVYGPQEEDCGEERTSQTKRAIEQSRNSRTGRPGFQWTAYCRSMNFSEEPVKSAGLVSRPPNHRAPSRDTLALQDQEF